MEHFNKKSQKNKLDDLTLLLIRRTHGMPAAIARVAGISPTFVSEVLSGRKQPSARFLAALPRAFELFSLPSQVGAFERAAAAFKAAPRR